MKSIYLIRHAKSSWIKPALSDFDRPLNDRGKNDIPTIAKELIKLDFNPELILCSPSKRTRETLKKLKNHLKLNDEKIKFIDSIYESSTQNLIALTNNLPSTVNSVALIAHNPAITQLSNYLTDYYIDNIPTCGVVKIDLNIDQWNEIIQGVGLQNFFIYPKMF